jgi:arsenite-transporting ATPase
VLRAPYFDQEVIGAEMLDRLAGDLFGGAELDPAAILYESLTQELEVSEQEARLRLTLPFARKGDISLKKIGLELIVRVDGHKRTMMLPPSLSTYNPTGASFEDGALEVVFAGAGS